jgi:hypothetical protein
MVKSAVVWTSVIPFTTHHSPLDEGEYTASRFSRINPLERTCGIYCIGGSIDLRAYLNALNKIQSLAAAKNRTLIPRISSRYTISNVDWATTTPLSYKPTEDGIPELSSIHALITTRHFERINSRHSEQCDKSDEKLIRKLFGGRAENLCITSEWEQFQADNIH